MKRGGGAWGGVVRMGGCSARSPPRSRNLRVWPDAGEGHRTASQDSVLSDIADSEHEQPRSFTLCGALTYLAPEMLKGQGHDKSLDSWRLGVFLFEVLTKRTPFDAAPDESELDVLQRILKGRRRIVFPSKMQGGAVELVSALLDPCPGLRLGAGVQDLKEAMAHHWFMGSDGEGFDWELLRRKRVPAPFLPVAPTDALDTSNFAMFLFDDEPQTSAADAAHSHRAPYTGPQGIFSGF